MNGFELILPFLRPIENLILDPEISEIMVNGPEHVFIERSGKVAAARMAAGGAREPGNDNAVLPGSSHRPTLEHIF